MSSLDYSFEPRHALIGAQMFFVAFGALVLVPLLTGLNASVAMFTAGVGTLAFQAITRGKVPIFLASSFAFIAPITHGINTWGLAGTLCGLVAAGLLYFILSLMVRFRGVSIVNRILPPIVTGPVIMVIGLSLAPVAISMATGTDAANGVTLGTDDALIISMVSLAATVAASLFGKGFVRLVPIMIGIVVGYAASLYYGIIDFSKIASAPWFAVPDFTFPEWNLDAVLFIVPVAIAPAIEHVGNIAAIGSITGRDYMRDPGLHNTLLGDGVATMLASFMGGPPNTTYAEVSGGIALTRAFNPGVMTWTAISAICLAFVGKLGAILATIPAQVMGGIMILLFGAIVVVGMNSLVRAGDDLMKPRNMAIVAVVLVFGLGGMEFTAGDFAVKGIGLAGLTGLFLHLLLPKGE
ncbi:uracil-xanthine permease family protein [Desulfovibrio sp. OttesenSCG-928-G15]|nr:uracil-xanthine permease family protein [Desulfovibrio sp. OttesenSCG-928-G15]